MIQPARSLKITPVHLQRKAVIYIRQSTTKQVRTNTESQRNQRALVERAEMLGWSKERIVVLDADLGQSGASTTGRDDFTTLTADVALGHVGIIFGWEVSRLARNNADWYHLLDLASVVGALIADSEGVYDPRSYNDRLLLGLKGTMSEAELHMMRQRLNAGRLSKVARGEYIQHLPTGLVRTEDGRVAKDPDEQIRRCIALVFSTFAELGSGLKTLHFLKAHHILLPRHQTSGLRKGELLWKEPTESMIIEILHNPAYAGAFVYGRRPIDPMQRKPGRRGTGVVRKPMEEWVTLQQGAYPAYISWEQFLRNQARLVENTQEAHAKQAAVQGARGAARERGWEEKLLAQRQAEEEAERFQQRPIFPTLAPELRQQLEQMGPALPALWTSGKISNEHKKRLLRSLISRVIATKIAVDLIEIKIVWVSGHFSLAQVVPPIHRQSDASNYQELIERIDLLTTQV